MTKSTFDGLVRHRPNLRPFILTRSFFAGSQKTAAVWTGDNMSKWEHLKISIPMLLSHSIAGITFVGADIPGFFFNPDSEELVIRWYQVAILHPFYRAHAHLDTKRREPWTFSEFTRNSIRETIRLRYSFMPYLYQQFYANEVNGSVPMRPLWYNFPNDANTLAIDTQYMIGDDLLVAPVLEHEAKAIEFYLPTTTEPGKSKTWWLNLQTGHVAEGGQAYKLEVDINSIPIFQRSGSIVPRR